ncbi:MAG TPA: tetratricopeptide repeat protein, partial [Mycobacteriales bacterium]|nr:tetratricopeptide repeat protein [Mycobacteriales bacterium]
METTAARPVPPPAAPARRRDGLRPWVVLAVAVLVGLGIGRFVTAGPDAVPETVAVPAAADASERIAQLERAVATDPRDVRSLQALATSYVARASETGDPADYSRAQDAADRAAALAPDDVDTLVAQGLLALALHDFDDALVLGERALAQRRDSAVVLGVVVDAQVELGRYDDARVTLQRMLDRDPGLPALARASYLRELTGDVDGAVAAMRSALASAGSAGEAAAVGVLLGGLLLQTGDLDGAAQAYDEALRARPGLPAARTGAARVQAVRGDLAGARAELEDLVAAQPFVEALLLLRQLQEALGDDAAAGATAGTVRAVAALQEDAGQVVDLEMALFEAQAGDPARAVQLAAAANAARPESVFVDDALAAARLAAGDAAGAATPGAEALRLGTASPHVRATAAALAGAGGDAATAREHLAVVLRGAPWA